MMFQVRKPALTNFEDIDGEEKNQDPISDDDIIDFDQK